MAGPNQIQTVGRERQIATDEEPMGGAGFFCVAEKAVDRLLAWRTRSWTEIERAEAGNPP